MVVRAGKGGRALNWRDCRRPRVFAGPKLVAYSTPVIGCIVLYESLVVNVHSNSFRNSKVLENRTHRTSHVVFVEK